MESSLDSNHSSSQGYSLSRYFPFFIQLNITYSEREEIMGYAVFVTSSFVGSSSSSSSNNSSKSFEIISLMMYIASKMA